MNRLASKLQNIDRRVLYAVLVTIVVFGLIVPIPLPLAISPQARGVYDAVENASPSKVAILCTNWSASTQGENRPQTRVVLMHMMRKKIRFVLMAFEQQSTVLAQELTEELAREHGYEYGRDWLNLGFRADVAGTLKGSLLDMWQVFKTDSIKRKPLGEFPLMQDLKSLKDASVIVEISPSGNYKNWIGLVTGSIDAPFVYGPTSVMAPELYTYLDSGQMKGMMFGIKGAAEYERLLGIKGFTTRAITPVSLALVLLFVLIALGNWGMYASRREEARG